MSEKMFAVSGDHLKHRFFAFWAGQETEIELKVQCEPLKHRFLDLTNSHLELIKRQEISVQFLATNWMIAFSSSPKWYFGLVKRQKMSSQCLATTWNIVFSTSPKSLFRMIKGQKISSQYLANTWNITSLTTRNSYFGLEKSKKRFKVPCENLNHLFIVFNLVAFELVKKQKRISKCNARIWNIDISTLKPRVFDWSRDLKWNRSAWRPLKTSVSRRLSSLILVWRRGRKWVSSAMGTLEISFFRLHPSRNLRLSKGIKWVQNAIRP